MSWVQRNTLVPIVRSSPATQAQHPHRSVQDCPQRGARAHPHGPGPDGVPSAAGSSEASFVAVSCRPSSPPSMARLEGPAPFPPHPKSRPTTAVHTTWSERTLNVGWLMAGVTSRTCSKKRARPNNVKSRSAPWARLCHGGRARSGASRTRGGREWGKSPGDRMLAARKAERATLVQTGCDVLQGYLFGKPARGFEAPRW